MSVERDEQRRFHEHLPGLIPFFCAFCAFSRQRGFPHLSRQIAHVPSNRLRIVVFQAGLKAGLCPAPASSGPVCHGIALLLAHCLAARPLAPACGLGDGAKPPENRQDWPVDALHQLWQAGAGMGESEKQFSFTRAALSTGGRAGSKFLSLPSPFAHGFPATREPEVGPYGPFGLCRHGR